METRRLAQAGLIGPPVFAAAIVAVTALEWEFLHDLGWSAAPFESPDVAWPSSAVLGDYGALQTAAFVVLAVSTLALAVAVRRLAHTRWSLGPALLALVALGVGLAAFNSDHGSASGGGPETWNGTVHAFGFTIVVLAAIGAMLALGVLLRRDERWRQVAGRSLLAFLIAVAALAAFVAGAGTLFFVVFMLVVLAWLSLVAAHGVALTRGEPSAGALRPVAG